MEVVVISLKAFLDEDHPVKRVFRDARHFDAVDLRGVSASQLLQEKKITTNAYETIQNGRKYHHEIDTGGAVGLHRSFYEVLRQNTNADILVCEDDCVPNKLIVDMLTAFRGQQHLFDMIVFGPLRYAPTHKSPSPFRNFDVLKSYYWGNHCIYFSTHGRSKLARLLSAPVDVHLDALFSRLAMYSDVRALIQSGGVPLAVQGAHVTTIQTWHALRPCLLCDTDPSDDQMFGTGAVVLVVVLVIVLLVYLKKQISCACSRK